MTSKDIKANKIADIQRTHKQLPEKKPLPVKKEPSTHKIAAAPKPEMLETIAEKPATLSPKQGIVAVDVLPYEVRNNLPNLNINVFSYADQPEDRFVIIDMVKYRTGQLIKGSVKLKEILPNSIVLQYGSSTFRIERPWGLPLGHRYLHNFSTQ
jgi:general secretion pathway protein B